MRSQSPLMKSAAVVLALGLTLTACGKKEGGPGAGGMGMGGPTEVGIVVVASEPVNLTTELSGRTSAYLLSEVRPQVSGIVKARLFTEGSYVKAGQPLYQIDAAPFQASYAQAQATVAQAEANLTAARLKAERYAELVKINAVSKQDNDDAQAQYAQARATVAAGQAALQTAGINVGYTKVMAPISGRIGKSNVTPGALVTAAQATELTRIQNIDNIYLDINQSVTELMALKRAAAAGQIGEATTADVELVLEDGTVYPLKGKLQFSDVSVDESTGTVTLRALFPNPNGVLLPGMYAKARIVSGVVGNGILVPQPAVTRDPKGNATVMVVSKDNKAEPRPIKVAQTVGDKWLVTEGLQAGDKVIVEGLQKIRPEAPVKPVSVGAAKEAPAAAGSAQKAK
ncbi:efflux RND transporter periplasmic adaptor subunit [Asticcacaulis sp. DW145]|uniref:Efflux RND transporter periplasmic adaptor subunit n=1 Tax=Asticcacaulis currens TaxID=2984210 RepID=A0ABT5IHQ9_9CAUL|nr:efflux RND transporter periplasmic adaptor subunit [Asticcacaulis currens]MDC7695738.1 efflux RND transporter periplasmic adaptor subunit [Asticcacaulis currens]BEV12868.1 efflux RND transporter periplasmic adaptor subunit [Asticcacaulis sp. DW145]